MTQLMENIKNRRSIRKYEERDIPEDMLKTLYESVQWAPSWANTQCAELIVIKDTAIKTQLQECISPKNPATKAIVNAPVVIAICGKMNQSGFYNGAVSTKYGDWFMFDLGLAAQNLCLVAHDLGLSTVIVGLFDHDRAQKVLNIPDSHSLVTLIPVGFPAKNPSPPKRKTLDDLVHIESFGKKVL
ncbi:nitroreductase family protein [Candidatus Magnetomorum sp. HK-1]|nr:nitroreductase family protein [Candidatus Magnetomorum sp. HK-1]